MTPVGSARRLDACNPSAALHVFGRGAAGSVSEATADRHGGQTTNRRRPICPEPRMTAKGGGSHARARARGVDGSLIRRGAPMAPAGRAAPAAPGGGTRASSAAWIAAWYCAYLVPSFSNVSYVCDSRLSCSGCSGACAPPAHHQLWRLRGTAWAPHARPAHGIAVRPLRSHAPRQPRRSINGFHACCVAGACPRPRPGPTAVQEARAGGGRACR